MNSLSSSSSEVDLSANDIRPKDESNSKNDLTTDEPMGNIPKEDFSNSRNGTPEPGSMDAIDQILYRNRRETMFELRRLQYGDRPVTGSDSRRVVEDFLNQALQIEPPPLIERRPESVIVEVQGLVERRPVSSILQSMGLRSRLERSLQGAVGNLRGGFFSQLATRRVPRTERDNASPLSSQTEPGTPVTPASRARSPATRGESTAIPAAPTLPPAHWFDQLAQNNQNHQLTPAEAMWQRLEEDQRDELVAEISELVQQQLVTSALESQFRNILEDRVLDRLQQSGTDGQRVQTFLHSIPRTEFHRRNDFSHLGIAGPVPLGDAADETVSVISATAAVHIPYAQSNTAVLNELRSLRTDTNQLKTMVQLIFDLQLDLQRAVRQEVAAALTQRGEEASNAAECRSRAVNEANCLICLDKPVDSVLYQCGHMCVCYPCGIQLRVRGTHCPVCRAPIRDIIRAYKCNADE